MGLLSLTLTLVALLALACLAASLAPAHHSYSFTRFLDSRQKSFLIHATPALQQSSFAIDASDATHLLEAMVRLLPASRTSPRTSPRLPAALRSAHPSIMRGVQEHVDGATDLEVANMCGAMGLLGITVSDLITSGAWRSLDKRLSRVEPQQAQAQVLLTLLKGLDALQARWHHLRSHSKRAVAVLLSSFLQGQQQQTPTILLRSMLTSLGSIHVPMEDLPAPLQTQLKDAALTLLRIPSPSSHHIVFALGNMRATALDRSSAALVKAVLGRSFPLTPRHLRYKIIVGMANMGFKWASLDVHLRRAVEYHLHSYAELSARQYRPGEICSLIMALNSMGVQWGMLLAKSRIALPAAYARTAKRMSARELSSSLLSLAALQPADDGLGLYDLVCDNSGSSSEADPTNRQLHRYFAKQAAKMTAWDKANFAKALLMLGATDSFVTSLELKIPHSNEESADFGREKRRATSSQQQQQQQQVSVPQLQRKLAAVQVDPSQLPGTLYALSELMLPAFASAGVGSSLELQQALQPLDGLIRESMPSWEDDETLVSMVLNALSKLYAGGYSLCGSSSGSSSGLRTVGSLLSASTISAMLSLMLRHLPAMSSRAASNSIYYLAKLRYELVGSPYFSPFFDVATNAFFAKCKGMSGQGEFSNAFFALSQLFNVFGELAGGRPGPKWKGRSRGVDKVVESEGEARPAIETLPLLLSAANLQSLQDALDLLVPALNSRDIATFVGTLRSLAVHWDTLPSALTSALFVKIDDCVADMDSGSISHLVLSLGSVGVELKAFSAVTRVRIRQQLSVLVLAGRVGGVPLSPGSAPMTSRELYFCLCGLGLMKSTWADFPTYLQDAVRLAVKAHALNMATAGGGDNGRGVIALMKGLCAVKAAWRGDLDTGSEAVENDGKGDAVLNVAPALVAAVRQALEQGVDDDTLCNLVLFLRKLETPLTAYPALLDQVLSRMGILAPLRPNDDKWKNGGEVDTTGGRGYEALPALLRELRALGVKFEMLHGSYLDKVLGSAAEQVVLGTFPQHSRRRLLAFLTHTCYQLFLMGASWDDIGKLGLAAAGSSDASSATLAPVVEGDKRRGTTRDLLTAAGAEEARLSAVGPKEGKQRKRRCGLNEPPVSLMGALRQLGLPAPADSPLQPPKPDAPSSRRGDEGRLLLQLSNRLPGLSHKDLLRAIYLLGQRKFPRQALLVGEQSVLHIIDSRITEMFPEKMGPVALVAVLASLNRLDLHKDDLPLSGSHILTHISSLASSLDRRTLLAAVRGLVQLDYRWQDLGTSQQANLAAGLARAATAKPTRLTALLQELQKFNLSWSDLHGYIPIVLRYVVFHMFTQTSSNEKEFATFFLGDGSGAGSATSELGADGALCGYTLEACGELLIEMVESGAQWQHLGDKAALAVVQTMTLKSRRGVLTANESRALQVLVKNVPPGVDLQFYVEN